MSRSSKRRKWRLPSEKARTAVPQVGRPSRFASTPWWLSDWWLLDEQGHVGDITCDVGTIGDLAVTGASIRGYSHRVARGRCEDSFSIRAGRISEDLAFLVSVIGDGLGSAKYSAFGSRRATELFSRHLTTALSDATELTEDVVEAATAKSVADVRSAVLIWTRDDFLAPPDPPSEVEPKELETTLTFTVTPANSQEDGTRTVFYGYIGDSPIFTLGAKGWTRISVGDDDEILGTATDALHSSENFEKGSLKLCDNEVLLLATDGVGNFLMSGDQQLPVGKHLAHQWRQPVDSSAFVSDLMFDFRTADDDRTAVVCWPHRSQHNS